MTMIPHTCSHLPDCFGCRIKTITFNTSPVVADAEKRDRQWWKDREAYRRLRQNGIQPKHVDGSAEVEAMAMERIEAEQATIFAKPLRKEITERVAEMQAATSA